MRDQPFPRLRPEVLSTKAIQDRAERLTLVYAQQVGLDAAKLGISFQLFYEEVIYPDYGIEIQEGLDLGFDETGNKIYGKYLAVENIVQIDRIISHDPNHPQRTFTYWHEVAGHGVLQGEWLRKQLKHHNLSRGIVTTENSLSFDAMNALERQANIFAARVGAPDWLLYHVVIETMDLTRPIRYCGPSKYSLQFRGWNQTVTVKSFDHLCWIIGKRIQFRFGWLSAEALGYRIAETNMIEDHTKTRLELHRTNSRCKLIPTFPAPASDLMGRLVS